MSELNINPEVSEKRFKEALISLNHNNRKRNGFKVDQHDQHFKVALYKIYGTKQTFMELYPAVS